MEIPHITIHANGTTESNIAFDAQSTFIDNTGTRQRRFLFHVNNATTKLDILIKVKSVGNCKRSLRWFFEIEPGIGSDMYCIYHIASESAEEYKFTHADNLGWMQIKINYKYDLNFRGRA